MLQFPRCVELLNGAYYIRFVSPRKGGGTTRSSLIAPAMDYAAFDVVAVVPVDNMEDRRSRRRDAIRVFEQVASDQFYVESAWLDDYAGVWWGSERDGKRYFWALCYALANARSREAFVGLDTPQKAQEAIRQFVLRVPATQNELALAVDKVLGRTADEDDPKRGATPLKENALDWAALVARLEGQSGIRADEWLWGRSAGYCVRAYNDLAAFADRYGAAAGNGERRRMRDSLDEAMDALARCKARIGRRIRAEREQAAKAAAEKAAADGAAKGA